MKKSFIYIAALTLLAACNKVESPVPSQDSDIITAHIEQETATRTYMDAQNNIRWSEGDQVVAFMKSSYGHKYQLISSFAGKTYADISKELDKIIEEHKNDEISKRTFDEMISRLQQAQEDQKFQEKQEEVEK